MKGAGEEEDDIVYIIGAHEILATFRHSRRLREGEKESSSHKTTNADATGLCGSLFGKQEPPRAAAVLSILFRTATCTSMSTGKLPNSGQRPGNLIRSPYIPLYPAKKSAGHNPDGSEQVAPPHLGRCGRPFKTINSDLWQPQVAVKEDNY